MMTPIRELLSRIQWDQEFGRAEFTIGYYDRIKDEILRLPLGQVMFDPHDHEHFQLVDQTGQPISIPLHRICEVYRNGDLIWHRERCHGE